ncbi:MAG: hypothetical protein FJ197_04030 [Gammaproteobacteria bacterium]|nr:hypothetical protein [Gammaproteobacteria bacterium]
MRIIDATFSLLFLLAAVLQYNDPDPLRWIILYACAALAAGLQAAARPQPLLVAGITGACLAWLSFLEESLRAFVARGDWSLLTATMTASDPLIEESRESLGLLLIAVWCCASLWRTRRKLSVTDNLR